MVIRQRYPRPTRGPYLSIERGLAGRRGRQRARERARFLSSSCGRRSRGPGGGLGLVRDLLRSAVARRGAPPALQARPVLLVLVEAAGKLPRRAGPHLLLSPLLWCCPRGAPRRGEAAVGQRCRGASMRGQTGTIFPKEVREEESGGQPPWVRDPGQRRRSSGNHREGPEVTAGGKTHGRKAAAQNKRLPLWDRNDGHSTTRKSGSARVEGGDKARNHLKKRATISMEDEKE